MSTRNDDRPREPHDPIDLDTPLTSLRRHPRVFAIVLIVCAAGGVVSAITTEDVYRSAGSVLPHDTGEALTAWMLSDDVTRVIVDETTHVRLAAAFGLPAGTSQADVALRLDEHYAAIMIGQEFFVEARTNDPEASRIIVERAMSTLPILDAKLRAADEARAYGLAYDGTNAERAHAEAAAMAANMTYWEVLKAPSASPDPLGLPRTARAVMGIALGLLGGSAVTVFMDAFQNARQERGKRL